MKSTAIYYFVFLFCLIAIVVANRYEQYVVRENFTLTLTSSCEPASEQCFDPNSAAGIALFEDTPYKKVTIIARNAPPCLEEHTCSDFTCTGIAGCSITYCSPTNAADDEGCVAP